MCVNVPSGEDKRFNVFEKSRLLFPQTQHNIAKRKGAETELQTAAFSSLSVFQGMVPGGI